MAKNINNLKTNIKNNLIKNPHPWVLNKIKFIRRTSKPLAARANRWGGPTGVVLIIFLLASSFFYPQNEIQKLRVYLLNHPYDFNNHLVLAEKLLANNQFEEAEKTLQLAQNLQVKNSPNLKVLGETTSSQLQELWQKKHYDDPKDIQRLIGAWGKIVQEKPNYRDGYLQLAILNYKIYENEKAEEYLNKALAIDPNFEPAKELKKIF
ncbi:MAG: hypothetical protein NTV20_02120 [Candidatus Shapirobacteria bacterium]|nr:hypothetical protein [Candidatus Shapirobacteria bacterium]